MRSDLGWRRMSKHSTSYDFGDFKSQREYISAAAGLFHPAEITFSDYRMVFVVAADTDNFPTFHSVSFLGWHRHKNGWLPAARATYVKQATPGWYATLSPLSGSCGLSLIALPVDDVNHPSKVFVIELAQPVLGTNNQYWGDGVLVYTVDATIDVAQARGPGSVALKVSVLR